MFSVYCVKHVTQINTMFGKMQSSLTSNQIIIILKGLNVSEMFF